MHFTAQQPVQKGDILVSLDDRQEKLALRLAQVQRKDAKSLLDRFEKAVKEGAVPQSEVDTARADYEAAQVAVEQAQLAIEDRKIIAPFDGLVGIPNVDPGDRVTTSTLITGVDARDILHIDFEVPEALVGALRHAQAEQEKVTVSTPAYPTEQFEAYIFAQESRVDPQKRTMIARAALENSQDRFRPGMSFNVEWKIAGEEYAVIPEIALQWGAKGAYIWLIRDAKAAKVPVEVIARKGGNVFLAGAIESQESVVVEGVQRMREGLSVNQIQAGP